MEAIPILVPSKEAAMAEAAMALLAHHAKFTPRRISVAGES
jgi:hypothetical protein